MTDYIYEGWVLHDEAELRSQLQSAKDRKEKADKEIKVIEARLNEICAEKKYGGDIR